MKSRKLMATGAGLLAAASLFAFASPAGAAVGYIPGTGGCNGSWWNSIASDQAGSNDLNGGCGTVAVKHEYHVPGSPGVYAWTAYKYEGANGKATTAVTPEIRQSWHRFYINSIPSTFYKLAD
jgi:hypothetical protein